MTHHSTLTTGRTQAGFTLIELLVVIAIIAILAAILFPVFARARTKAKQANATSNAKQCVFAQLMYASDYDGCVASQMINSWGLTYWWQQCEPYLKSEVYIAKANAYKHPNPFWAAMYYSFPFEQNARVFWDNPLYGNVTNGCLPREIDSFRSPTDAAIILESGCPLFVKSVWSDATTYPSQTDMSGWPMWSAHVLNRGLCGPQVNDEWNLYSGGGIVGFADGHVKWYKNSSQVANAWQWVIGAWY